MYLLCPVYCPPLLLNYRRTSLTFNTFQNLLLLEENSAAREEELRPYCSVSRILHCVLIQYRVLQLITATRARARHHLDTRALVGTDNKTYFQAISLILDCLKIDYKSIQRLMLFKTIAGPSVVVFVDFPMQYKF